MFLIRSAAAALCALSLAAAAQAPFDATQAAQERARIQAERERLEAGFSAEEARCAGRFAVTACLDDVRLRRREALALPRAQALAIDDAERRARADARRAAVAEKQRRAAALPPMPLTPASAPVRAPRELPPPPVVVAEPASRPGGAPAAASAAARRVDAARQRQAEIRATQQRIEARQAERTRQNKPSAPLPVPPAASRPGR